MENSSKQLKEHLQDFLDFCEVEKGLRKNTQENYKNYLHKFFNWLDHTKNSYLLPHQLTADHIWTYRLYLSRTPSPVTGKLLSNGTQNYYLIALRALLGYFVAKDILSLHPGKIALPKPDKSSKTVKFPDSDQVMAILDAPQGNSPIILRDRAILHTIISTGIKVHQLTDLNRDRILDLPNNVLPYLNDYIKTRDDLEKALFINYSGMKNASRRLTDRMVQKIIKKYSGLINGLNHVTPETLRFANILATWDKKVEIKSSSWQKTEEAIKKQIIFLKEGVSTMPGDYKSQTPLSNIIKCDDCIFRKIAILIVASLLKIKKISIQNFWRDFYFYKSNEINIHHGSDWHRRMINSIAQYFTKADDKNKIIIEPILSYGKADIGIIKNNEKPIYIEVGTVSLFKVWYNLMVIPNCTFILVPNDIFVIKLEN